jgi:translation initiation factor IF-2
MIAGEDRNNANRKAAHGGPTVALAELAQELGMGQAELASKLHDLAPPVTSEKEHVSLPVADRLRRALRGDAPVPVPVEEERLSSTVIRRRRRGGATEPTATITSDPRHSPARPEDRCLREAVQTPERSEGANPTSSALPPPGELRRIPQATITGRAATGRFVQLRGSGTSGKAERPPAAAPQTSPRQPPQAPGETPIDAASRNTTDSRAGSSRQNPAPSGRTTFKEVRQPVITGAAATGRFIQLPGRPNRSPSSSPDGPLPGRRPFVGAPPGGRHGNRGPEGTKRSLRSGRGRPKSTPAPPTVPIAEHKRVIRMADSIAVSDLAQRMSVKATEVVKRLWALGMMGVTINQSIDFDTAAVVASELGYQVESVAFREEQVLAAAQPERPEDLRPRAPVVTVMGHVDHGKTSLLDALRKSDVAGREVGGITQHIGAHKLRTAHGEIVFLDTPGHEAFTAMRARGAQVTDLVVLVVAADDGPMPQTVEAINHTKSAGVPLVVAVNKIDVPGALPAQVRTRLMEYGLVPEELGGDTIYVDVSAKTRQGLDRLLEMLALQAELLELKANPEKPARGHVIEARLDRTRGAIATLLVKEGTLRTGDLLVAGESLGRVRAMVDDTGRTASQAAPSTPMEILGLDAVPDAGDSFNVVNDERAARALVEHRHNERRSRQAAIGGRVSLEHIFDRIREGAVKTLNLVLKADVQGSVGALVGALGKLATPQVAINIVSAGVGGVTESDVTLAKASSGVVVGFNVRPAGKTQALAEREGVELRLYQVVYDLLDDVRNVMTGLLAPVTRERLLGRAEARKIFTVAKAGGIAGCTVLEGRIARGNQARVVRDSVVVSVGKIASLRRFKEDVTEVDKGYECGLAIEGYRDLRPGDVIEAFELETVAATLDPRAPAARDRGPGPGRADRRLSAQ